VDSPLAAVSEGHFRRLRDLRSVLRGEDGGRINPLCPISDLPMLNGARTWTREFVTCAATAVAAVMSDK